MSAFGSEDYIGFLKQLVHGSRGVISQIVAKYTSIKRNYSELSPEFTFIENKRSSASSGCLELFNASFVADVLLLLVKQRCG